MTLPIDIVLVRHGESEGNAAKRAMEHGDPEALRRELGERHTSSFLLSPKGEEQARAAGEWMGDNLYEDFDRYLVSDYKRAMQTAGLLDFPDARWYREPNLVERDWGVLERLSDTERAEKFAENMRTRDSEPFFWKPGETGESFLHVRNRCDRVLATLHRECSQGTVVIVCHGEVMWAFRVILERMSQERFKYLHLSKNPDHRIHNCQIIHYTRRNPHERTGRQLSEHVDWMRMIRPTESPVRIFDWEPISRPTYTNEQLLELTSGTASPLASESEQSLPTLLDQSSNRPPCR